MKNSVQWHRTVYPKKYAHFFCFAVLCCGYTLTDFPISIRLTSLAVWQSNDCPSASKASLMNMDKYFMWIHYERLHNHNKAKHNKTVCIFLGIYCMLGYERFCEWCSIRTLWSELHPNGCCRQNFVISSLFPEKFELSLRQVAFKLILMIDDSGISCEITLRRLSLDVPGDKSPLVQAVRQQTISWTSVDQDLRRSMASQCYKESKLVITFLSETTNNPTVQRFLISFWRCDTNFHLCKCHMHIKNIMFGYT